MRVLCAPDSFKGSLTAHEAARAMVRGVRRAGGEAVACPMADGGEGTVDAMVTATGGRLVHRRVNGPQGEGVDAAYGVLGGGCAAGGGAVVIEAAAAAGLTLVPPHRRDPERTTTRGVGELIAAAVDAGAERIVLGIGGSATNDAGCGAAQALGVDFRDASGRVIDTPITGGLLTRIARIDTTRLHPRLHEVHLEIACDVTNPLTGPEGAAAVYGPQKGATPEAVRRLDEALHHWAAVVRRDLGVNIETLPGGGAAGGLGAGAVALLGGTLRRGVDLVLDHVRFDELVEGCDLCLTGEGCFDEQTLRGKAIAGVAAAAGRVGVPVAVLAGRLGPGAKEAASRLGIATHRAIGEGASEAESVRRAADLLAHAAAAVVRDASH